MCTSISEMARDSQVLFFDELSCLTGTRKVVSLLRRSDVLPEGSAMAFWISVMLVSQAPLR